MKSTEAPAAPAADLALPEGTSAALLPPAVETAALVAPASVVRTPASEFWRKFKRQRVAVIAGIFVLLLVVTAVLAPWLAQFGITLALDVASIKAFVVKYLSTNFEDAFGSVLSSLKLGGSVALAIVGNAVLIPVALFFLLKDWDRFVALVIELVPPKLRPAFDSFLNEADSVLGQYLRGQLLVMGVLALYFSVALALFGFDLAVPVGVFTGLAFFIPFLGFGLGMLLALLAGILQFGSLYGVLVVAGVYGAGQLVESFYLTPRLVGERIGLHPLAVIFALLAFGRAGAPMITWR